MTEATTPAVEDGDEPVPSGSRLRRPGFMTWWLPTVAVLAFLMRLIPILHGGGLDFYGRYDDDVYYAASDAVTFGRVPYRGFVLLHPPGLIVFLMPFAALGRVTSDPFGIAVARLAFMAIGALNTVFVTVLSARWGRRSAVVGGLVYATWMAAIYGEQATMLEPLGTTALLVALLLLVRRTGPPSARAQVLAGLAMGLSCTVKIWYVAPLLLVLGWQLVAAGWRPALRAITGAAVGMLVVLMPFFWLAPGDMYDMVVRDQLLRPEQTTSRLARLPSIVGVKRVLAGHHTSIVFFTVLVAGLIVGCALLCLRDRAARILTAVLAVNTGVLFASPTYYEHYASLTAAPAVLVLSVGFSQLTLPSMQTLSAVVACALPVGLAVASGARVVTTAQGLPFPGAAFDRAAPPGCVAADDPGALIDMNRLSSDFREGCRVAIDVTGITYGSLHREYPDGEVVRRPQNTAFQQYLVGYLTSARSFVVARAKGDGSPRLYSDELADHPALARADRLTLRSGTWSDRG